MIRATRSAILVSLSIIALSACEDGLNVGQGGAESTAPGTTVATTREGVRDVERPDVFTTTEQGLWDGRPSLGGIWVAHPDVTDPERAILINESTGQRVAGALFRRERNNPGPRLQVSSDAAAALNILAGQPTEMTVIAVRREEIVVEEPDPVISDEQIGEDTEATETDETTDSTDGEAVVAAGAAAATTAAAAEEAKPRRGFFERIFGPRRKPTPEVTAIEDTTESAAVPDVETQTLDPVTTTAAAAIARAEADDKPAPRPARAEAPANSQVRNPFIQVGLFSVQANASSAAANLRQEGIIPSVLQGERNGAPFWRVVVGPVTTADDQAKMLARIKRLGYSDAFLAPN